MKTSSFFVWQHRPGGISIARWAPKGFRHLPHYPSLAPGEWFNRVDETEYCKLFAAQLAKLSAPAVHHAVHALVSPHNPVLLCWEPPGKFCHRRLAAEWFKRELGIEVVEASV